MAKFFKNVGDYPFHLALAILAIIPGIILLFIK